METIIQPVERNLLKSELTQECFVRDTNKAENRIYIVDAHCAPNVMREIGRLRELSFRSSSGGTGSSCDIDVFDTMSVPYRQIVVWNPDAEEIVGGYRFIHGRDVTLKPNGQPNMAIEHLFDFSPEFLQNYLPQTVELGRAFVQPKYQSLQMGSKSIFALDNLWDGIGALIGVCDDLKYLIGKVTIFSAMKTVARNAILYFLDDAFGDRRGLLTPKAGMKVTLPSADSERFQILFNGNSYKENLKLLNNFVRSEGEVIPVLIRAYIELSSTMRTFGTCLDDDFGHIYDTGMMVTIADIYPIKRERYIGTFLQSDKSVENIL